MYFLRSVLLVCATAIKQSNVLVLYPLCTIVSRDGVRDSLPVTLKF